MLDTFADDSSAAPFDELPESLRALPPERAAALVKFCLGVYNLNEFTFVD
ncbi:MAG: hypothetical protein R3C10_21900 [Pirellulales bacterium]